MPRRPRIDLAAPPFRGHLHPILGVARALRAIADVRVLTTADRMNDVAASGLEGIPLLAGRENAIAAIANPSRPIGSNPMRLLRQFRETLDALDAVRAEVAMLWRENRPDLVLADSVLPSVGYAALAAGARWWTTVASPCAVEPRRGAPPYLGGWHHRDDWLGRGRDRAGLALVRGFKRLAFALHRARLRAWGAAGPYRADGSESVYSAESILGLGMAELELPREWPAAFQFLGPVMYTPPCTMRVEPRLESGRRHVFVSLGTQLPWAKAPVAATLRALAERERRWVIHFSDGNANVSRPRSAEDDSEFFRRYDYVPYDKWVGRFDFVVHHAGTGVMFACVSAARPALVFPVDYDQFDYAARIEHAGIGSRLRSWGDLPTALARTWADEKLGRRCEEMQASLAAYRPDEAITELVRRTFGQSD